MSHYPNLRLRLLIAGFLLATSSCAFSDSFVPEKGQNTDVMDRQQGLTIEQFRDMNNAKKLIAEQKEREKYPVTPTVELGAPPIPDLAQVLAAPHAPKIANTKLVTLSVTEDVPLRDVLFELGRLAKVDIEVGPGLDKGGINLRATDRPFNEVIERIADLANLRYTVGANSIRVEKDTPYIKSYSLDFLNIVRSSTSGYTLSTSALSSSSGGGSSGGSSSGGSSSSSGSSGVGTSGSTARIDAKSESDLWTALDSSIGEILNYSPGGGLGEAAAGASVPAATGAATPAGGGKGNYVINKQAGLLTVNATDRQHEMIRRFLTMMTRNSSAQVLIEAKIVEVQLSDDFQSGVDWSKVLGGNRLNVGFGKNVGSLSAVASTAAAPNTATVISLSAGDLDVAVALMQTFGTIRTLSSPRLSAINNQQAILTFVTNEVYYTCTYTPAQTTNSTTTASTTTQATETCETNTLPLGILLNVLPSIDLDSQQITLNVRPTITRKVADRLSPITSFLQNQANIAAAQAGTTADTVPDVTTPVVEVREIDSIAKVRSGGVMVIGGLMQDSTSSTQNGVPGFAELPIFGNLFKSRDEASSKTELIIFIKASIVNSDGSSHPIDRAIYNKYSTDPRPLFPANQ